MHAVAKEGAAACDELSATLNHLADCCLTLHSARTLVQTTATVAAAVVIVHLHFYNPVVAEKRKTSEFLHCSNDMERTTNIALHLGRKEAAFAAENSQTTPKRTIREAHH